MTPTEPLTPDLIRRITRYQLVRTPIRPADLCLVFGTRRGAAEFAARAAGLWHDGLVPRILVSGGATKGVPRTEADEIGGMIAARGVPERAILREHGARHTGENVTLSLPILEAEIGLGAIRSVIGIGKICTSRRYLMTLQRHWPETRKMVLPVNYHGVAREDWPHSPTLRERVLTEWAKFRPYLAAGYIAELDPATCEILP